MSDKNQKRDGLGVGEAGGVPEGTAEDLIETARIIAAQRAQQPTREVLPCMECGQPRTGIVLEAYRWGVMGSGNLCETCLRAYIAKIYQGKSLEQVIEMKKNPAEGRCARCGKRTTNYVSGAGQYLCPRHEDDY